MCYSLGSSPVRVGLRDVDAGQRDDGQTGGSDAGLLIFLRCCGPDPFPLPLCLPPRQRGQLQVAGEAPVDFAQFDPEGAAAGSLTHTRFLILLRAETQKWGHVTMKTI